MLWKSVVGKLWLTIIFLFSFVLFILTVLLLEFFHNQSMQEAEQSLFVTASQVESVIKDHENYTDILDVIWQTTDEGVGIVILLNDGTVYTSLKDADNEEIEQLFRDDGELKGALSGKEEVKETTYLPSVLNGDNVTQATIVGIPLDANGVEGAIYTFQSVDLSESTSASTTKFILIAVLAGILLITVFAFFLLTRVTAPLRRLKEGALELSKGKFDMKVPIISNDEIGDLSRTFNRMAKQLKHNVSALQEEKENLSNILSSMADGVITFNRDGEILVTNPPAEDFLSYIQMDEANLDVPHTNGHVPEKLWSLFQEVKESETTKITEVSVQGRDWVILMNPLYDARAVRGAVAVLRDMTEERRLDKMRKDFIANVSHELRTPIAMMQGYSEAIIDDIAQTHEEKKDMAQVIYDESLRMGRLVNELLDLARMEAGHLSLNKSEVEIGSFIERIVKKFKGLANEKQIKILAEMDQPHAVLFFDPDRMEQVFTNLVDNALRHTPEGGEVRIIQRTGGEKGTVFEIKDTGVGISAEELPFVFERFYKVDKARTRGRAGTGLGLAIVKNIIYGHGGKIEVMSKLGQGTTFTFFLPAKK